MMIGAVYEWLDADVQPDVVYYYKLEDIDVKGASTFHGPVSSSIANAPAVVRLQNISARVAITPLALVGIVLGLAVVFRRRR